MFGKYNNIKIAGIQAAAPQNVFDNEAYAEAGNNRRIRKFINYTGIKKRHLVVEGQSASDLSSYAADVLLDNLKWDRNEIRVLVNVTQSEDVRTPSTAMIIQKRLGIGIECLAFDVNLGCSAYPSGLQIIAALLQNTGGKGLLLVGDGKYYPPAESYNSDSLLFGDGAAATAIEICDGHDLYYTQNTDGSRFDLLCSPWNGELKMDGNGILLMSLNEAANSIIEFREHFGINDDSIDFYVLHQAQKIIIDGMIEACGINSEKALRSYEEYGNTSSATLPVTISSNYKTIWDKGEKVTLYLCGFGVGLAWNGALLTIDSQNVYPLIETDHKYNDLTEFI